MDLTNKKALSKVRLEHARDSLLDAKVALKGERYKSAANRSYYAIFHAMRAVLAFDGIDKKKHSGIISDFRKLYIKTNIFPVEMSDIIDDLFEVRKNSDYDDFYVVSKKAVKQQIINAEEFIKKVEKFLKLK